MTGVRHGVSADHKNNKNLEFPSSEMTEPEERMLISMAAQIGLVYREHVQTLALS